MSKTHWIKRAVSRMLIAAMMATSLLASSLPMANAAIEAADYFTMTSDSPTVNAGGAVTLTISSLTTGAVANPLVDADFAYLELRNPANNQMADADIVSIGGNAEFTASKSLPWGGTTVPSLAGDNDTIAAVNFSGGSVGTITVKAGNNNFSAFVWAPGAMGGPQNPPQNMQNIAVSIGSGAADHLVASTALQMAEVGQEITYTITQVNSGGGKDAAPLSDVGVSLAVSGNGVGAITKVNGVDTEETPGASISNMALTAGVGTITVVISSRGTGNGDFTVTPSSATLLGVDQADTFTADEALPLTIQGYGPPNGQNLVPTNAPIDIMFNKDPDPTDVIFPLTNTNSSILSLTTGGIGGTAVAGQWNVFSESFGDFTAYRTSFQSSTPLTASTTYTATILKSAVPNVDLPGGMPILTDAELNRSFTLTTGQGGGSFVAPQPGQGGTGGFNGGFTGTLGGEFPPMAFLNYPMPRTTNVPTNTACITVGFDRDMQGSTLTTANIYLEKLVGGVPSVPAGTPVVTALQGNKSVCISGYTLEANTDYRVVVTRDVRDSKGSQIAGMPESNGATTSGMGFGFENMGPFREQFKTGAGAGEAVAPALMGLNVNKYKSGGSITGVPTGMSIRASFGSPLNSSTVNSSNVFLKRNGTVPEAGSVFYDAMSNTIEFVPTSILSASTSYIFSVSTGVTSVTGTAIAELNSSFTTGAADVTKPMLVYADADNYGLSIQFDEALNEASAINKSYYTFKTCSQAVIAADGTSCTGGGPVTTASLLSGVNVHYERDRNTVWMDGLTLTPGDGFYIAASTGVLDVALNAIHATDNKSWTGIIMDGANMAGGQGMFNMGTIGMEDFDMKTMGMKPVNAMPMNTMAGATTKYFVNVPIGEAIPSGGYIELTFPAGFVVTGAKRDAQSPANSDMNGPSTGTVTFATTIPSITGLTDGGGAQANDGIGYITAARKVIVKLSAATQADDFLHFDLDGITNSSEPKSFDTSGYNIEIKTFNTTGELLEGMTTMPFFISSAGTGSVSGQVKAGLTGLNGAKVFLGSPMTGPMEITTSNDGAGTLVGGSNDGEYKFENLPAGQYFVFTEPMFTSGDTDYYGNMMPEPLNVEAGETKDINVTAATASGKATQPVSITFASLPSSLGFNDSIDIFAFNPSSRVPVIKTVSRATLGVSPYSVDLFLPSVGDWNIGIGPSMPKGPMGGGMGTMGGWMPPQNVNVTVAAADLDGPAKGGITLAMSVSDKTITGKVIDGTGTAVANAEVYAYDPQAGKNAHTTAIVDGSFSLSVTTGSYKVGAFLPGLPGSQETPVLVSGSSFFVDGSTTASTGSSAGNPFNLKITVPDYTIQGRVATSDGSAITGSAIWGHRTDAPGAPLHAITDSSGNYTLYVSAGAWKIEGDAPNYGYLGSKDLTVTTASLSSQDFEVASTLNTVEGTINIPGTTNDSGTIVSAYCTTGSAEAKTDTDGYYTLNLPDGTCTIEAVIPGVGDLPPLEDVVVNGNEVGQDFTVATPQTSTITLSEAATEETVVKLFDENGAGNECIIPEGSTSCTLVVPEGTYYLDADVPGTNFEDLIIAGGEFNVPNGDGGDGSLVTTDQVNIDGTGDAINITLPELFSISGVVTSGASGVNDAYVSVYNQATKESFGVMTSTDAAGVLEAGSNDGEFLIKVQAGTYTISVDKAGTTSTPVDVVVSADSAANNFSLTTSSKTISGTTTAGANVWAEQNGGGFASTEASIDGTYTLNVDPGIWTVNSVAEGYGIGTPLSVDVTTTSATSKNFTLTALTGENILQDPTTESITPSSGGTITDEATGTKVVAPPNVLGTSTDAGQISSGETNDVLETPTANPVGNGHDISATDADGNPITTLDDDVIVSFRSPIADLIAEGIDTPTEAAKLTNAYWDETAGNWVTLPTTCEYYTAAGTVIPENTVGDSVTLVGANVNYMDCISEVNHFTTFASVVASGATPPATPSGLTATAGDASVALSWTKNSEGDMSRYDIWEANVTEGVTSTLTQAACTVTPCTKTITGLTNGTAYSFQIIAVDTDGNSSAGSTAAAATPAAAVVVTPSTGGGGGGSLTPSTKATDKKTTKEADKKITDKKTPDANASGKDKAADAAVAKGSTPLKDIEGHWAQSYVEDLYAKKIISGADETHYNPNKPITRAEFTKVVVNTYEIPKQADGSFTPSFKDVKAGEWYAAYVQAAFDKGLVEGFDNKTFNPNKPITRAEAMKILLEASGKTIPVLTQESDKFKDVYLKDWFAKYVIYAAENGIVNGFEDGTFGPNKPITRGEVAKIVSLLLKGNVVGMIVEMMNN